MIPLKDVLSTPNAPRIKEIASSSISVSSGEQPPMMVPGAVGLQEASVKHGVMTVIEIAWTSPLVYINCRAHVVAECGKSTRPVVNNCFVLVVWRIELSNAVRGIPLVDFP